MKIRWPSIQGQIIVDLQYRLLHTKHLNSWPYGFRKLMADDSQKSCESCGGANFGPQCNSLSKFDKGHKTMLHTKYENSSLCSFIELLKIQLKLSTF